MAKDPANILVVDDDPTILTTAKLFLKQHFEFVQILSDPGSIDEVLTKLKFDVVLLDMNYSQGESDGAEGLALIDHILSIEPTLEIIPVTAYGEIDLAVKALKKGARDFVTKPWQNDKLYLTIRNILDLHRATTKIEKLESINASLTDDQSVIPLAGKSPDFQKVLQMANKVAETDANVLILGENGTGKSLLAKYIHTRSSRASEPFSTIDLGSLPPSLFESELFGHKKGAFTDAIEDRKGKIQIADGGTLFLDEIGNIEAPQQSKLLTVLEQRKVTPLGTNKEVSFDVRLISATNQDPQSMSHQGAFRQDLLYRINTITLHIPPLRERKEDIPDLAKYYFELGKKKYNKPKLKLQRAALEALEEYSWPGNIRELEHVIERAIILADGPMITIQSFQLTTNSSLDQEDNLNLKDNEKTLILKALEKNKGNITHAARDLGIDRLALYRRLEKYGL